MTGLMPDWLARDIQREEEKQRLRIAQLGLILQRAQFTRKGGKSVTIPFADECPGNGSENIHE